MSKVNHNLKNKNANFVNLTENDITRSYVKDIMKIAPLSEDEEYNLMNEYISLRDKNSRSASEDARMIAIKQKVIAANQRFVYAVAKRYAQTDDLLPDLIDEANIAFDKAFETYDINSGAKVCTFASWAITGRLNNYLTFDANSIKQSNKRINNKIEAIREEFLMREQRDATDDEIIEIYKEKYDVDIHDKRDLLDMSMINISTCYDDDDSSSFENSEEFNNHSLVPESEVYNEDDNYNKTLLSELYSVLDDREKLVITMMYGEKELSPAEISVELGVCSERVRQIAKNAIKKMREYIPEVKTV